MKTYRLDVSDIATKEAFHLAIGELLSLPEHYGKNLDALFDCLSDLTEHTQLMLNHSNALEENLGDYGTRIRRMLTAAAQENPHFVIIFDS